MRLSIVIPCFNEEGNIAQVVHQASEVGRELAGDLEIIVVDDGSTDDTGRILRELRRDMAELRVLHHARNQGYGAAVRTGLAHASLDHVFLTDGDGQFDLEELPKAALLLRNHDVVAGYRLDRRDGWWRRLWGRSWTMLMNRVLGIRVRDANCAFKLLPRTLAGGCHLTSRGALISAELLFEARRLGLRVAECPVHHFPRRSGAQTGASPRVIATALFELFAFVRRSRATASSAGGFVQNARR